MEICRGIDLDWSAPDDAGTIVTSVGDRPRSDSGFTATGGDGPSPETLLLAAIASSYSITLSDLLRAASLRRTRVAVHADGVIASDDGKARFTRILIKPTIRGADLPQRDAYKKVANAAREECLIGRSVRGNVALVVGDVSLPTSAE